MDLHRIMMPFRCSSDATLAAASQLLPHTPSATPSTMDHRTPHCHTSAGIQISTCGTTSPLLSHMISRKSFTDEFPALSSITGAWMIAFLHVQGFLLL